MPDLVIGAKLSYICDKNSDKSIKEILLELCGHGEMSKEEYIKRIELCFNNGGDLSCLG